MTEGKTDPDPDPVRRLSHLLRERPELLLDRWQQRVCADPHLLQVRHGAAPTLRDDIAAIVDRIAARLDMRGGARRAPPPAPWEPSREDAHTVYDLPAALGELSHLRRALLDLCAAEEVRLSGEAQWFVHTALDEAMTAIAAAIARGAIAAARRERERLDLTLRLLPVGVLISDAEGRLLAMNEAARRIWGAEAPLARTPAEYDVYRAYRPGATEPIAAAEWGLARALQGEAPRDEDLEIVSFDGSRRMILNSALAVRDATGAITGGVAVNVDVTDRKRTELCLGAIIEGALDAIVLIDAGGRITEFNAAAEQTFGYARGEAIGRELAELIIEPELREAHRRGIRRYLMTGESGLIGRRVEMRAMRADGALFDVELTVIRLPPGGPAAFAGFARDITERKSAERERVREAEFRERFMGILGHDLRTPLSAIMFAAESLRGPGALLDAKERGVERILRSAGRIDRMIRDLLDLTRTRQGGGIPVTLRAVDLASICRHVLEEIELTHPGREVALRSPRGAQGRWDPDRVAQVVQNLVVNALEYSPAGAPVEVVIGDADRNIVLTVKNDGPAIPRELLPHLFDPFRRGAQGDAGPATRGLGLGLYIAHEIVRAHHGRMEVDSDPTRGTTFLVEMPRWPEQAA